MAAGLMAPMDRAAKNAAFAGASHLLAMGKVEAARTGYLALMDRPDLLGPCLHQLAVIAALSDSHRALVLLHQALQIEPAMLAGYRTLAQLQLRLGQPDAANATWFELANVLQATARLQESCQIYMQVIERDALHYGAVVNMGTCLIKQGQLARAKDYLWNGLRLYARFVPAIAVFLDDLAVRLPDAVRPIEWDLPPGMPTGPLNMVEGIFSSLGSYLQDSGEHEAAKDCNLFALRVAPDYALAHWNLALLLLADWDFKQGWQEYEWRWRWPDFPEPKRNLPVPVWQGEPLQGKRILVWSEQGLGDTLQFLPLIKRLLKAEASVLLEVPSALIELCSLTLPEVTVIARPDHPDRLNTELPLNYAIAMMSLPHRLGLRHIELPLATNYVVAREQDVAAWRKRIAPSDKLNLGFVWAGRPENAKDTRRSLSPQVVRQVLACADVNWYALQVGNRQASKEALSSDVIEDLVPEVTPFCQTAAAISLLDGVVTVDTSTAHLAGALGKPVLLLLSQPCDWRWGWLGADTPWYPSVQMIRQTQVGDWQTVIEPLQAALAAWAKRKMTLT